MAIQPHFDSRVSNYMTFVLQEEEKKAIEQITPSQLTPQQLKLLSEMSNKAKKLSEKVKKLAIEILSHNKDIQELQGKIEDLMKEKAAIETKLGVAGTVTNTVMWGSGIAATGVGLAVSIGVTTLSAGAALAAPLALGVLASLSSSASRTIGDQKTSLEKLKAGDQNENNGDGNLLSDEDDSVVANKEWNTLSLTIKNKFKADLTTTNAVQKITHILDQNPNKIKEYKETYQAAKKALDSIKKKHAYLSEELAKVTLSNTTYKIAVDLRDITEQFIDTVRGIKRPKQAEKDAKDSQPSSTKEKEA